MIMKFQILLLVSAFGVSCRSGGDPNHRDMTSSQLSDFASEWKPVLAVCEQREGYKYVKLARVRPDMISIDTVSVRLISGDFPGNILKISRDSGLRFVEE